MIIGIHHVAQAVPDISQAIRAYEEMGYTTFCSFTSRSTPALVTMMTHPNRAGIELFEFETLDSEGARRLRYHIAFESTSLEDDFDAFERRGYLVVREIGAGVPVRRLCFLEDTLGNLIELVEPWPEELLTREPASARKG